jgi:hypothetical protein
MVAVPQAEAGPGQALTGGVSLQDPENHRIAVEVLSAAITISRCEVMVSDPFKRNHVCDVESRCEKRLAVLRRLTFISFVSTTGEGRTPFRKSFL